MLSGVKAMMAVVALTTLGAPAFAQADWKAERDAGRIGEQPDGYLAVVGSGSPALQKVVADVNALRREKYFAGAGSQTPAAFAQITACNLIRDLPASGQYRTPAGQWRQRGTGAPELAAICPQ